MGITLLTNGGYPHHLLELAQRVPYESSGLLLDLGSPGGLVSMISRLWGKAALHVHTDLRAHLAVRENFRLNGLGAPNSRLVASLEDVVQKGKSKSAVAPQDVQHVVLPADQYDVTQVLQWVNEAGLLFPHAELFILAREHSGRRRIMDELEDTYMEVTVAWTDDSDDAVLLHALGPNVYRTSEGLDSAFRRQHALGLPGGRVLTFNSLPGLFSHRGIDTGSQALVDEVNVDLHRLGNAVDLGCGYAPIGLSLAALYPGSTVCCVDVDLRALWTALRNARENNIENVRFVLSDGWSAFQSPRSGGAGATVTLSDAGRPLVAWGEQLPLPLPEPLELVTANPPFHEEYAVARRFIEGAYSHLVKGGRLYLAIKKARWYQNKLRNTFGGSRRVLRNEYTVLMAAKQ